MVSESGLPTNCDTKFQIFILQWNPPICKKKSKGIKRMLTTTIVLDFTHLFCSSLLLSNMNLYDYNMHVFFRLIFPPLVYPPLPTPPFLGPVGIFFFSRRESLAEDLRRLAEAKRRVRREEAEEVRVLDGSFDPPLQGQGLVTAFFFKGKSMIIRCYKLSVVSYKLFIRPYFFSGWGA